MRFRRYKFGDSDGAQAAAASAFRATVHEKTRPKKKKNGRTYVTRGEEEGEYDEELYLDMVQQQGHA